MVTAAVRAARTAGWITGFLRARHFLPDRFRVFWTAQFRVAVSKVVQRAGKIGVVTVWIGGCQVPENGDRLLSGRYRLHRTIQLAVPGSKVLQRVGEIKKVLAKAAGNDLTVGVDDILASRHRLSQAVQL